MVVQHQRAFYCRRPSEPLSEEQLVAKRREVWLSRQPAHKRAAWREAERAAGQPTPVEQGEAMEDLSLLGWRREVEASAGSAEMTSGR